MTQLTKSLGGNIEVLSANGLSTFVDDVDGILKLKDAHGVIEPFSSYCANPITAVGGLFAQTSSSTPVSNTTVATSIITSGAGTLTIPANGFTVGNSFVAYLSGVMSSQNNAQIEFHFSAGGVVLADSSVLTLSATTNKNWQMMVYFTIRKIGAAGTASIATSGNFTYNKDSANIPESLGFSNINSTTFNTTISNTLSITAQWGSASASNSITTQVFTLNQIY